ncbi:hypothetical protein ACSTJK_24670, partial [Vibrio parahaemolyticus]
AKELGIAVPAKSSEPLNKELPADAKASQYQPLPGHKKSVDSPALSLVRSLKPGIISRKVAILAADGFD